MARKISGSIMTGLINTIQGTRPFRAVLEKAIGIDAQRILPQYAKETFVQWYFKNYKPPIQHRDEVLLFVDTYTNFHEPQIGRGLLALLDRAGIKVSLADVGCCQRPRISNGFLRMAKEEGRVTFEALHALGGKKVVVCEPSCASALLDDLPDLLDDGDLVRDQTKRIYHVADYLHEMIEQLPAHILAGRRLLMHGHCHEKALFGTDKLKQILLHLGAEVEEVDSGCCGMAGSFGYEKEHFAISQKIGERRLLPAVRNASPATEIVANGFSCRHQIDHFTPRSALHWLELFLEKN